jgi:hypothetical protein
MLELIESASSTNEVTNENVNVNTNDNIRPERSGIKDANDIASSEAAALSAVLQSVD